MSQILQKLENNSLKSTFSAILTVCKKYTILSLFLILSSDLIIPSQSQSGSGSILCPKALGAIPNVCSKFKCVHNITQKDCPPDTFFLEKFTLCGCCPGCAKFIGLPPSPSTSPDPKIIEEQRNCTNSTSPIPSLRKWEPSCSGPFCPILLNQCMPGLDCLSSGQCTLPTRTMDKSTEECMYKKTLKRIGLGHWDPDCEPDGSYSPKQCKGDLVTGICFCVDRGGNRIFGQQFRIDAKNQTCECSRQVKNLRDQGNMATMHCSPIGNYEALQCDTDSGLCYCVDEKTGLMNGAVVPQHLWTKLPCLTPNVTNFMRNGHYLRKCESIYAGSQTVVKEGRDHGTEVSLTTLRCDYDGSYGSVQKTGSRYDCVYKNGTTIKDFFGQHEGDCNCARDEFLYQITGRPFSVVCDGQVGNYPYYFDFGSYASCIDRDGIPYGDLTPSKYACCLSNECIPSTGRSCYDPLNNPKGYRACCLWPFGGGCKS